MSIDTAQIAESAAEPPTESLAERLARCPLPLQEALRCAMQVGTALRRLHAEGLAYGEVSSQLIFVGESGAVLRPAPRPQNVGEPGGDVTAFGKLLDEMLRCEDTEGEALHCIRAEAHMLALRCRSESPSMQHVLINLRLLAVLIRQQGTVARPVTCQTQSAMLSSSAGVVRPRVRIRIRMSIRWKPLARLVVACGASSAGAFEAPAPK